MATYPIKLQNGDDILLPITYAGLVQINDNSTTKPLSTAWDSLKISYSSTNGIHIRGISGVKINAGTGIKITNSGNTLTVTNTSTNTDAKVKVNKTTDTNNYNYPLIFKYSNNDTEETTGLRFDSDGTTNSYYNPAKNTLYVKYTYATEFTENGTVLSSKYAPLSHVDTKGSTTEYGHVKVDSSLSTVSTNPVQNKIVKAHVDNHASTSAYGHVKVDDTLNNTSTNPVQNKVIYTKMIENEQTTAIGLAVLNSRLDTVEATSSQISNYISKSGSNKVDNDQEIHWSQYSGNIDGLHITNSSIGWTGGQVNTGGIMTTYSIAIFSRSGISIGSSLASSGLHFNVSGSGTYTYVRVGGNNKISLESNGTAGQIVAPKFMENSDERLKTDIERIASIDEINMYEFNMNDSHMYGFVAQDLEKTHPELVTTSSDDSGEINNVKSVDYNSSLSLVVSKLINKITELEERIKELEKK